VAKSGGKPALGKIIWGLLTSPDYTLKNFMAIIINGYLKNNSLIQELLEVDLSDELENVQIPYRILQGSTDIVTPTKMAATFVGNSSNPQLSFRQVENGGHMPGVTGMDVLISEELPRLYKTSFNQ
jgi:pimeloyl-ACP methyl ester carboxylesterase